MKDLTEERLRALERDELFAEWDSEKILFTCYDQDGWFVAVACASDDTPEKNTIFLYLPLEESQVRDMKAGKMGLRHACRNTQEGKVFQVTASNPVDIAERPIESIPEKWLPEHGTYLDLRHETPLGKARHGR